jgi:hypothetical protein
MTYVARQRERSLAAYYRRLSKHLSGCECVDARDQELRDRGTELRWRVRVLRNEQRRAKERLAKRIAAARQDAIRRWHPERCATVHDIGRKGRVK